MFSKILTELGELHGAVTAAVDRMADRDERATALETEVNTLKLHQAQRQGSRELRDKIVGRVMVLAPPLVTAALGYFLGSHTK
jgi:hypothetical protein